jgi:hypothetical protein
LVLADFHVLARGLAAAAGPRGTGRGGGERVVARRVDDDGFDVDGVIAHQHGDLPLPERALRKEIARRGVQATARLAEQATQVAGVAQGT